MAFTTEEKDGRTILKVEGALSIYEASALREALLACLENDAGLELDLGSVTECDTAGLQLLYAARKTARKGKSDSLLPMHRKRSSKPYEAQA